MVVHNRARFDVPRRGAEVVLNEHLRRRLESGAGGLVLVCAPAGYGKTSQVAAWAGEDGRAVAWVDLESADNDPGRFAAVVTSMLDALGSGCGPEDVEPLPLGGPAAGAAAPIEAVDVGRPGIPFILVLDDIQVITDPAVLHALGVAAARVPDHSTIVLIGRNEPDVPLARLRVDGRVVEVTATDLALSPEGARSMFNAMGIELGEDEIERYVGETEGWPVGLRLAALLERDEVAPTPGALARDRILTGYLQEEWLLGTDEEDQEFLLRVSGLEWLSGRLCDEILGRSDSGKRLERIHRTQLVIPLDRRGDAYRLHGLLRSILDADFERLDRDERREIDIAASEWFERAGDIDRAVHHACRADDVRRLIRLVSEHGAVAWSRGRVGSVRRWLGELPSEIVTTTPSLCLLQALVDLATGRSESVAAWLRIGLSLLESSSVPDRTGPDLRPRFLALRSTTSIGPVRAGLEDALAAYDALPPGVWHATACQGIGVHSLALGLTEDAVARLSEGIAEARLYGVSSIQANSTALLAVELGERGDWAEATRTARSARDVLRIHDLEELPTLALVTAMSALVEAMAGDLQTARAEVLLTRRNLPYVAGVGAWGNVLARLALAHASLLLDDRPGARILLDEAETYLRAQPDATRFHEQLRALDARLANARAALPVGPSALTTAELRVLHLLPTHLSIGEIAERLYISRHTAKSHAAAVYRKLGVASRGQAVEQARRAGLIPDVSVGAAPR
jgi:LuxR family maltose regulon positive regulatory protein